MFIRVGVIIETEQTRNSLLLMKTSVMLPVSLDCPILIALSIFLMFI